MNLTIPEFKYRELDVQALKSAYDDIGCVIIRDVFDEEIIQRTENSLKNFFSFILEHNNIVANDTSLDFLFEAAQKVMGSDNARYLLTIGKDLPAFKQLINDQSLVDILEVLLATKNIQSAEDNNVLRIDRPQSELTNLPWHQDYPYNMLSQSAVTTWIPILPVDADMGRVKVILPKSELQPIVYDNELKKQFHNSRYIQIKDLDEKAKTWDEKAITVPEVKPGDLLAFNSLLLHKSGTNLSNKSRWVATARFGSMECEDVVKRNWFTARAKYPDIFRNYHPEHFIEK